MDLNRDISMIPLRWTLPFRLIIRKKIDAREVLTGKYGVEGYTTILASEIPLILPSFPSRIDGVMFIFVFI